MQRRHYQKIADILHGMDDYIAIKFADEFDRCYENFDRDRFLKACGVVVKDEESDSPSLDHAISRIDGMIDELNTMIDELGGINITLHEYKK